MSSMVGAGSPSADHTGEIESITNDSAESASAPHRGGGLCEEGREVQGTTLPWWQRHDLRHAWRERRATVGGSHTALPHSEPIALDSRARLGSGHDKHVVSANLQG